MAFSIKIEPPAGLDVEAMVREVEDQVANAIAGGVKLIEADAKRRVARGPKTGRIYETWFRTNTATGRIFPFGKRSAPHQASAPGEAPATDTGLLIQNIVSGARGLIGGVEARVEYAAWLEFGTRRMAARPFLIPAAEAQRSRIDGLIRSAVATGLARFATKARNG